MRTRGNQLLIQILLMVIITVIIAFTCMNLAELVDQFCDAASEVLTNCKFGF